MKRKIAGAFITLLTAGLIIMQTAGAIIPGNTVYRITREIADNLQYVNTVSWDSTDGRGESFVLRYTKGGDIYPIAMKDETIYGPLTISDAVKHAESTGKNVIAALNSDFFSIQTGVPFGIVIEDGVYKSSPSGRNAVSFDYNGGVRLHKNVDVKISLENQGGPNGSNGGKTTRLTNFNKYRVDSGGLYLFTEHFSAVSTRTVSEGWFVRFKILEGHPSVSGVMTLEVTERITAVGEIEIGEGYMVLSAALAAGHGEQYDNFAVGDIVTLTTECSDSDMTNARYATGAGDPLVSDGRAVDTSGWDEILQRRSPRTAIGITADGTVIFYTIDGRDPTKSVGLIPTELVDEMLRHGAVEAINLDGGGSTSISMKMPGSAGVELLNKPSDGKERKCSTYIFLVTDKTGGGGASKLSLANDGVIVLSGSSEKLKYAASNSGFYKTEPPSDIWAGASLEGSFVTDGVYTAGDMAGVDLLSLSSQSTGTAGRGNVVVITEPTSLTITEPGSTEKLTNVVLEPGQTFGIDLTATYYRRPVTAQLHSFDYEISGNAVEMIEPGVFVAAYTPSAVGTIKISAGGTSAVLNVEIKGFDDMEDHWARPFAAHLAGSGIVKGISETEYGPDYEIRRADFILMLYRAKGEPITAAVPGFEDVATDAYYASAIAWARENAIAAGVGDGLFEPTSPLTRQQAFTFVYRALNILGVRHSDNGDSDLSRFADSDEVAEYALIPASVLVNLGVVEGSDGFLEPSGVFTRGQMAKVLSVVLKLPKEEFSHGEYTEEYENSDEVEDYDEISEEYNDVLADEEILENDGQDGEDVSESDDIES